MIRVEPDAEDRGITFFRLARTLVGRPVYVTGAYLVGEALVDCGPPVTARELALGAEERVGPLRFEVIPTPGHSPDHACFFERERGWLFTGDLFLAERLRYLRDDEDLSALIASLEEVARLSVSRVFCAHRGPVRDGPAALRRKAERLSALRGRVRELLAQGLPEREITRRAVGREGFLTWFSRGRFSARNFVRAVAGGK